MYMCKETRKRKGENIIVVPGTRMEIGMRWGNERNNWKDTSKKKGTWQKKENETDIDEKDDNQNQLKERIRRKKSDNWKRTISTSDSCILIIDFRMNEWFHKAIEEFKSTNDAI